MQLIQDLTEVIEMSGEPVARMEVFANHIPDEWVRIAAALSDKVTIRREGVQYSVSADHRSI